MPMETFFGAVTTKAQTKASVCPISSTHSDTSIEETSSLDDQPLQEEGHEFDVLAIAEAQKDLTKCSYILNDGILYTLFNRDAFTQKLIYVPSIILQQLLKAYHDAPGAGHFGFRRTYFNLKVPDQEPVPSNSVLTEFPEFLPRGIPRNN
ncbi:unnamed protein product [Didymodactylos carnosus]|uniref:Integrase zinc-binding domain-containing protein n=1 Tax=Didymodactylos carnosus TaxID=1234261 RepID=A0A8S2NRJ1_9BILA|nr:unnamed protein product [Didymodactylos carnosus]CAF4009004.1 unnamed protein product [Didymodactylos carnosus]